MFDEKVLVYHDFYGAIFQGPDNLEFQESSPPRRQEAGPASHSAVS